MLKTKGWVKKRSQKRTFVHSARARRHRAPLSAAPSLRSASAHACVQCAAETTSTACPGPPRRPLGPECASGNRRFRARALRLGRLEHGKTRRARATSRLARPPRRALTFRDEFHALAFHGAHAHDSPGRRTELAAAPVAKEVVAAPRRPPPPPPRDLKLDLVDAFEALLQVRLHARRVLRLGEDLEHLVVGEEKKKRGERDAFLLRGTPRGLFCNRVQERVRLREVVQTLFCPSRCRARAVFAAARVLEFRGIFGPRC